MGYIDDCENPQIGDFFLVRTVKFQRNNGIFHFPVVDNPHRDGKYGLDISHYHVDWRFMPQFEVDAHREVQTRIGHVKGNNNEYYSPVAQNEVIQEYFSTLEYQRDNNFSKTIFHSLKEAMKNCVMVDMRCPHHGTNLTSCKPIDGVVTCPQHGLKWDIKTGKQII